MDELIKVLEDLKPGVDFKGNEHLIDDGILESLDIVSLVAKIDDEFDVEITFIDVVPENFNSAADIWALIQKLQNEE